MGSGATLSLQKNCGYGVSRRFVSLGKGLCSMPKKKISGDDFQGILVAAGIVGFSVALTSESDALGVSIFVLYVVGGCLYVLSKK